jgi:hypothetical protein
VTALSYVRRTYDAEALETGAVLGNSTATDRR